MKFNAAILEDAAAQASKKIRSTVEAVGEIYGFSPSDVVVTGGAVTSLLSGGSPRDYDLYFRTPEKARDAAQKAVDMLKCGRKETIGTEVGIEDGRVSVKVRSAGVLTEAGAEDYRFFELLPDEKVAQYMAKLKERLGITTSHWPACLTSNAASLHSGVQLVIRFTGEPESLIDSFDFLHCRNYWTSDGLVLDPQGFRCWMARSLEYQGSAYPLASLVRMRKFLGRGFSVKAGSLLKLAWDISRLDLQDPLVLQDQLIGVDMAYFRQFLAEVQKLGSGRIDHIYLSRMIDEFLK